MKVLPAFRFSRVVFTHQRKYMGIYGPLRKSISLRNLFQPSLIKKRNVMVTSMRVEGFVCLCMCVREKGRFRKVHTEQKARSQEFS